MNDDFARTIVEQMRTAERDFHSANVRRGIQQAVESGRWPFAVPLGYLSQGVGKEKQIVLDPTVAPLIQQAFSLAAEGKQPLSTLLLRMTERGLVSKEGQPLTIAAFLRLLTNPFYRGHILFQGKVTPGVHPALIETDCFQRVQQNLALRMHPLPASSEERE